MSALINVLLPVFLIIGVGFTSAKLKWLPSSAVDGVMLFTQKFAIPCLLFNAIVNIEIGNYFNFLLIVSYFIPSLIGLFLGILLIPFYSKGARSNLIIDTNIHFSSSARILVVKYCLFENSWLLYVAENNLRQLI